MQLTVDAVTEAKSGKSLRVKCGDTWYGAGLKSGLKKGMVIEAAVEEGQFGPWIDSYREANGAAKTNGEVKSSGSPWWMPFVSNTVAHAISAGYIQDPSQIGAWAKSAMETAVALGQ